jgi:hypothetical protein
MTGANACSFYNPIVRAFDTLDRQFSDKIGIA